MSTEAPRSECCTGLDITVVSSAEFASTSRMWQGGQIADTISVSSAISGSQSGLAMAIGPVVQNGRSVGTVVAASERGTATAASTARPARLTRKRRRRMRSTLPAGRRRWIGQWTGSSGPWVTPSRTYVAPDGRESVEPAVTPGKSESGEVERAASVRVRRVYCVDERLLTACNLQRWPGRVARSGTHRQHRDHRYASRRGGESSDRNTTPLQTPPFRRSRAVGRQLDPDRISRRSPLGCAASCQRSPRAHGPLRYCASAWPSSPGGSQLRALPARDATRRAAPRRPSR